MAHPSFRSPEESEKSRALARAFLLSRPILGINGIKWKSVLDEQTTPECRALNGKEWDFPSLEPRRHKMRFPGFPPIWYNCRSDVIPLYD